MLVFTTEPLQEDLEVTGRVLAKIYLSTCCEDTDVVIRLTDVYPDGRSILIADGIQRLANNIMTPQEVEVDLWSTSIVFAKGHRIRVSVTSSNYPRFEKSIFTALNKIHMGGKYHSHIVLPLVH